MTTRQCKTCEETKPLDKENYYFNKSRNYFETKCKECTKARLREKYATDTDHREAAKAYQRTPEARDRKNKARKYQYSNDEEYRESLLAAQKEKYATDSEFREKIKTRQATPAAKDRKNELGRGHYARDQEYRENLLAQQRNPEHREKQNSRRRERRVNDPKWRDYINAQKSTPEARDQENSRRRERLAADPAYREQQNIRNRKRYHDNPARRENISNTSLTRRYGISRADYDAMEAEQNGCCAICGLKPEDSLHVDHNHHTHQVRGLLCGNCNFGIGKFNDNPDRMASVIKYLERPTMHPQDIKTMPDERLTARSKIPNWEAQSRDNIYLTRRNRILRKDFGINIAQYEALLEQGNGVCWICSGTETQQSNKKSRYTNALSVDHDHDTNMIRGLLCSSCNFGIGQFKDDPKRLTWAIKYLEQYVD